MESNKREADETSDLVTRFLATMDQERGVTLLEEVERRSVHVIGARKLTGTINEEVDSYTAGLLVSAETETSVLEIGMYLVEHGLNEVFGTDIITTQLIAVNDVTSAVMPYHGIYVVFLKHMDQ